MSLIESIQRMNVDRDPKVAQDRLAQAVETLERLKTEYQSIRESIEKVEAPFEARLAPFEAERKALQNRIRALDEVEWGIRQEKGIASERLGIQSQSVWAAQRDAVEAVDVARDATLRSQLTGAPKTIEDMKAWHRAYKSIFSWELREGHILSRQLKLDDPNLTSWTVARAKNGRGARCHLVFNQSGEVVAYWLDKYERWVRGVDKTAFDWDGKYHPGGYPSDSEYVEKWLAAVNEHAGSLITANVQ